MKMEGIFAIFVFLLIGLTNGKDSSSQTSVDMSTVLNAITQLKQQDAKTRNEIHHLRSLTTSLGSALSQKDAEIKTLTATVRGQVNSMKKTISSKDSEITALKTAITRLIVGKLSTKDLESRVKGIVSTSTADLSSKFTKVLSVQNTLLGKLSCVQNGWQQFKNLCYKSFSDQKSWDDANDHCKTFGGSLAIIPDQETNDWFFKELNFYPRNANYIGLHYAQGAQRWLDGELMRYSNYKSPKNLPIGSNQKLCTVFFPQDAKWNDYECATTDEYICQTDPQNLPKYDVNKNNV